MSFLNSIPPSSSAASSSSSSPTHRAATPHSDDPVKRLVADKIQKVAEIISKWSGTEPSLCNQIFFDDIVKVHHVLYDDFPLDDEITSAVPDITTEMILEQVRTSPEVQKLDKLKRTYIADKDRLFSALLDAVTVTKEQWKINHYLRRISAVNNFYENITPETKTIIRLKEEGIIGFTESQLRSYNTALEYQRKNPNPYMDLSGGKYDGYFQ